MGLVGHYFPCLLQITALVLEVLGQYKIEGKHKGSISPTFYTQLLHTLVVRVAFLCLHFKFVLYWCKPVGATAVRRTLVKLALGDPGWKI